MAFDAEKFISDMEARPALWDTTHAEYLNKARRQDYWLEIFQLYCPNYDVLSPEAQANAGNELQKRWKNLRNCFAREMLRKKKLKRLGNGVDTRKTYVHFQQMSFLTPFVGNKCPHPSDAAAAEEDDDDFNNVSENEDAVVESGNVEESRENPSAPKRQRKTNVIGEDKLYDVMTQNLRQRVTMEKRFLEDDDKLFMISLAGELKKVPADAKLELKANIIQLIKKAQKPNTSQSSSSNNSLNAPSSPLNPPSNSLNLPGNSFNPHSNPLNPPSNPLNPPVSCNNMSFPGTAYQPILSNLSGQTLHIPYGTFQLILPNIWGQQQSITQGFGQPVLNPVNVQTVQGPPNYTQPPSRASRDIYRQSPVQRPQTVSRSNPSPDPFSSPSPTNVDSLPFDVTNIKKLYED